MHAHVWASRMAGAHRLLLSRLGLHRVGLRGPAGRHCRRRDQSAGRSHPALHRSMMHISHACACGSTSSRPRHTSLKSAHNIHTAGPFYPLLRTDELGLVAPHAPLARLRGRRQEQVGSGRGQFARLRLLVRRMARARIRHQRTHPQATDAHPHQRSTPPPATTDQSQGCVLQSHSMQLHQFTQNCKPAAAPRAGGGATPDTCIYLCEQYAAARASER